ncbi:MAG: hypothetical protein OXU79_20180 [Gemmatimonadota bacterium]|nr:hypothetical protein [Gemmatimonadota bacterium]
MHTSQVLSAGDFEYWQRGGNGFGRVPFESFCPDYHESDRTGVVSPFLEDGILHASHAILALTTAFYDAWRARTDDFFIYPQHFAILDISAGGVNSGSGRLRLDRDRLGWPWGNLDVWPDSQWISSDGSVYGALKNAFDLHINRLFWPESFVPGDGEDRLPEYALKIMRTRLKAVFYYRTDEPNIEIRSNSNVKKVADQSVWRLSQLEGLSAENLPMTDDEAASETGHSSVERYRKVEPDQFLDDVGVCFESGG